MSLPNHSKIYNDKCFYKIKAYIPNSIKLHQVKQICFKITKYIKLYMYPKPPIIDKIQTGYTELTKASRVQNCVHSNSFINDDIFVEKSQTCQSVHTFKLSKYLFTDTWVHYEDLILHFCKVSKPLEFITFQLVIHCF